LLPFTELQDPKCLEPEVVLGVTRVAASEDAVHRMTERSHRSALLSITVSSCEFDEKLSSIV
jgi:hypothetical protein